MKFKNKAERNKDITTLSSLIFKDKKLVNERPDGMTFEEYHTLRKYQTQILKSLFKTKPNRQLQGVIPSNLGRISSGAVRKIRAPRKAS